MFRRGLFLWALEFRHRWELFLDCGPRGKQRAWIRKQFPPRSEEHTSELQSHSDLVCRLLLEKKKNNNLPTARTMTSEDKCTDRRRAHPPNTMATGADSSRNLALWVTRTLIGFAIIVANDAV